MGMYQPLLADGMTLEQFSHALLQAKKQCKGREDCLAIQQGLVVEELTLAAKPREWVRMAKKVLKKDQKAPKTSMQVVDSKGSALTPPLDLPIGGVGVSPTPEEMGESVVKLTHLREQFSKYMLVKDPSALDIVLAIVAGHYWGGRSPGWMLIIGPPGSGKTEYIDILERMHPLVQPLSDVTEKTWVSGLDASDAVGGVAPSLLDKYPNNIFTYKDLTTMLSKRFEGRVATFGQFTEIFDGHLNKKFGTGLEFHWEGFATMLMGVTQIIYNQHAILSLLGPRFLLMRLILGDDREQAKFSLGIKASAYKEHKTKMQDMVRDYFLTLPKWQPDLPLDYHDYLSGLGTIISRARSSPKRDNEGDIEMTYEAEMPARVTQQLARVAQGLALVHGKYAVEQEELAIVRRLAIDTILPVRAHIITKLYQNKELGVGALRNGSGFGDGYVQQALSDMRVFDVVEPVGDVTGGETWRLTDTFRSLVTSIGGIEPLDMPL